MRAVLLSDAKVAQYLQDNFVLCWNSVRPAPKVTIDFGNGEVLERTIKGNTTFHVCLPDGRVVDSLPGVYKPEDFLTELKGSLELAQLPEEEILQRHRSPKLAQASPDLLEAMGKGVIEAPLVLSLEPTTIPKLEAPGEIVDVSATGATREDFEAKYLPGEGTLAQRALEADSKSSLDVLRPAIHEWFGSLTQLPQPSAARRPIYKDILKVDIDDPYLGLKVEGMPGT